MLRSIPALSRAEWLRLSGFGGAVALLHIAGWGLFVYYSQHDPALAGLGTLAYTFGLRHAFDADHIAAIDNTTRKLLQQGKRPLGVGFFFSLGHSTIVFSLAASLAFAATTVNTHIPAFQTYGGLIGASVSGTFLWIIGILNLLVLIDILRIFGEMRRGVYDKERLEQRLLERGFMSRLFIGRLFRFVSKSWHMYPLGILFGLGFDTASEVALLGLAATSGANHVPIYFILILPALFAAGMSLVDSTDGIMMLGAYGWAYVKPIRKLYYNLNITLVSVLIAFLIGGIEVLSIIGDRFGLSGGIWDFVGGLDFGIIGFGIIAIFVLSWSISTIIYRRRGYDDLPVAASEAALR